MSAVTGTARVTAAAVAMSVTLAIVWSLAAVAHPAGPAKSNALAQACASAS